MTTGTIMKGEGGDRKFTVNGRNWRVRVRINDEIPTQAPVNGDPVLAPSVVGVSISVAALTKRGKVEKDAQGRLLVFDAHVLSLMREQMARPDFDPEALINATIVEQIAEAETKLAAQGKLTSVLGSWAGEAA